MTGTVVNETNNAILTGKNEKQPKALLSLSMTEVWERFSYWALYSLLVLYMINILKFPDAKAYIIFGAFNALMYASPIIGGWLADRYLSANRAIIHGGIWLVIGYGLLAMSHSPHGLFLALGLLIWGNGLFKPNISTILGACYHPKDARRERGFTLYYMAINIGATIGVIGCGWLSINEGWRVTFVVVASVMILGLINYLLKRNTIKQDIVKPQLLKPGMLTDILITLLGFGIVAVMYGLIDNIQFANIALGLTVVGVIVYMAHIIKHQLPAERGRTLVCLILITVSIAFWALYMQMGSSLTMYTARCAKLTIFSYPISPSMVGSANGIWLFILAPILVTVWRMLNNHKKEPATATKFFLGVLFMASGYGLLVISAWQIHSAQLISLWWIVSSYGLQTLGELCLSPIGLAMVTQLAPTNYKGLMMGVWFLATAIASWLSGWLAKVAAVPDAKESLENVARIYAHAFSFDTILGITISLILLALLPTLKRMQQ